MKSLMLCAIVLLLTDCVSEMPAWVSLHRECEQLYNTRRFAESAVCFESALASADSSGAQAWIMATLLWQYGGVLHRLGRYRETVDIWESALDKYSIEDVNDSVLYAQLLGGTGSLYDDFGMYDSAETRLIESASLLTAQDSVTRSWYVRTVQNLASLYSKRGYLNKAEVEYRNLLGILRRQRLQRSPEYGSLLLNLGNVYLRRGRNLEADSLYAEALAVQTDVHPRDHEDIALALNNLSEVRKLMSRFNEAESLLVRANAMYETLLGAGHPQYAWCLTNRSELELASGKVEAAESFAEDALALLEKIDSPPPSITNAALDALAEAHFARRDYDSALVLFTRSLVRRQLLLPADHPDLLASCANLARVYLMQNKVSMADSILASGLVAAGETTLAEVQQSDHLKPQFIELLRRIGKPEVANRLEITPRSTRTQ